KGDRKKELAILYHNIGLVYSKLGDAYNSIDMVKNAIVINEELGLERKLGDNYQAIAIAYEELYTNWNEESRMTEKELLSNVLDNYKKALEYYQKTNYTKGIASCYTNLGVFSGCDENYEDAIDYASKALDIRDRLGNKDTYYAHYTLGNGFQRLNRLEEAEKHLLIAYDKSKEGHLKTQLIDVTSNLYQLYAQKLEFEAFSRFHKEHRTAVDSFQKEATARRALELKEKYETERKEQENQLLRQQKELIQTRSNLLIGIGVLLFLGLLTSLYFFYRLRENKKLLEQLNASKNRLFAILAHDLKGPAASFNNLTASISYLLRKNQPERLLELADYFEKTGDQVNYILTNLLDWAVSQKDEFTHQPVSIDVHPTIKEIVTELGYLTSEKKVAIQNEIEEQQICTFDRNAFSIVVRNLLHNAIKYSHPQSKILVQSLKRAEQSGIRISDSGIGMSQERIKHILEGRPIESVLGTASEKGNSLGLSTCIKLVEKNRGKMKIQSQKGHGTAIELWFEKA
ncbi:MAG: ATP-binding protein, partial [Bacteroidota bacterium]